MYECGGAILDILAPFRITKKIVCPRPISSIVDTFIDYIVPGITLYCRILKNFSVT